MANPDRYEQFGLTEFEKQEIILHLPEPPLALSPSAALVWLFEVSALITSRPDSHPDSAGIYGGMKGIMERRLADYRRPSNAA